MSLIRRQALLRVALSASALLARSAPATAQDNTPPAPAPALPVAAFARLPMISDMTLSPDGRRIAALLNEDDTTVLVTRVVDGTVLSTVLRTDNQRFHFSWVQWVNNERLLASVRFADRRDFVGTVETRLLSVRADGSGLLNLVETSPLDRRDGPQQFQDRVVDWLPEDGQHVLLQLTEGNSLVPSVFKVNVETGRRQRVLAPMRHVRTWLTDANHRVRIGVRSQEGEYEILACDPDGTNWRTLWAFQGLDRTAQWPLGFGKNPQELFVRADHEGRNAVFSVDLASADLARTLRLAHPRFDLDGALIRSPVSGEVVGLRTSALEGTGETRAELWEPQLRALARSVDQGLPGRRNRLLGFSRDEKIYLLHSSGNGIPGQYYLGHRDTGEVALLADQYPQLDPGRLSGKQVVQIRARDGLDLMAFLSRPRGITDQPLPLVLLPHGGPQGRDNADFDSWTEFLASRGYAVLQVNFRGSSGYGHDFKTAGLRRWGLEMQDDLSDAVQWAVKEGVADPARVGIVGASYGGYAALMGVVKTPGLFRCAVSFAGVSDLIDLIQHKSDYVGGAAAAQAGIGRAWGDREQLRATSPALHAERIEVPVLLVHGTADRSVPVDQSRDMARALRRAGKPHRYIEQEDGDHHLSRYSHRLEFFLAMEGFLAQHLAVAPR